MIYKGQFTSRDDTIYVVEIDSSKVDGLDTKKDIKLGVPPFTVKYEGDEDLNKPIRMSEATINVLTTDTPWDLVTNKATDVSVKLFKINVDEGEINGDISSAAEVEEIPGGPGGPGGPVIGPDKPVGPDIPIETVPVKELIWAGYVEPSVYDMPQDKNLESFEINCIDELSVLQYKYFGKGNEDSIINPTEKTFYWFISEAIKGSSIRYIYTPIVYNYIYSNGVTVRYDIFNLYVNEKSFIDDDCFEVKQENGVKSFDFTYEDNDTYKDIIEKMMNFLNLTMVVYGENMYLLPVDYLAQKNLEFIKLDLKKDTKTTVNNTIIKKDITKLYAGTTVSQTEMFNQMKVLAKMKEYDSIFPDFFEDKYLSNIFGSWAYTLEDEVVDDQKDDHTVRDKCRWRIYENEYWTTHYYNNAGQEVTPPNNLMRLKNYNGATILKYGVSNVPDSVSQYKDYKKESNLTDYVLMTTYADFNGQNKCLLESKNMPKIYFSDKSYILFKYDIKFRPDNGSPWHIPSTWADFEKDNVIKENMWLDCELSLSVEGQNTLYYTNVSGNSWVSGGTWTMSPSHCRLPLSCEGKPDHMYSSDFSNLINSGIAGNEGTDDGFVIRIPDQIKNKYANVNFKMYSRRIVSRHAHHTTAATWIKNLSLEVNIPRDETVKEWQADSEYSAVISDEYVNEGEKIDFEINSFNDKVPSWTCVLVKEFDDFKMANGVGIRYLTNEPYHLFEEWKIYHKVMQHQKPMRIVESKIEGIVTPTTLFKLDDKYYVCDDYEIDFYDNKTNIKLTELWNSPTE